MQGLAFLVLVLCLGASVGQQHRREGHRRHHRQYPTPPPPPDDRFSPRYGREDDIPYTGSYDVLPETDIAMIGIAPTEPDDDDVVVATVTPDGESGVFVGRPVRGRGGRRGGPRWGPPPPDRKMVAVLRRMKWRIGEMMQEMGQKIEELEKRGKPEFTVKCDCGGNSYQPPAVIRLTSQAEDQDGDQ